MVTVGAVTTDAMVVPAVPPMPSASVATQESVRGPVPVRVSVAARAPLPLTIAVPSPATDDEMTAVIGVSPSGSESVTVTIWLPALRHAATGVNTQLGAALG